MVANFQFLLVSLTSCLHKIVARVLSKLLKTALPHMEDRSLMTHSNELINEWKRKKRRGVTIKLDVNKSFDKVDWGFLNKILVARALVQNEDIGPESASNW